jgi:hypothetical protein
VSIALAALALASIGAVIWLRLFTDRAVPMWAGTFVGASILVFLNAVMLSLIFSFTALGGRQASGFIPERDYRWFVDGYVDLPVA